LDVRVVLNCLTLKRFLCEQPLKDNNLSRLIQEYYATFITSTDNDTLYHLTLAANYLDIQPLLDLCSARIASFIKDRTVEEIRTNLGIVCDFTPEEEAQVREENKWADDL
jgi:S-phase kinase-associated protein 1